MVVLKRTKFLKFSFLGNRNKPTLKIYRLIKTDINPIIIYLVCKNKYEVIIQDSIILFYLYKMMKSESKREKIWNERNLTELWSINPPHIENCKLSYVSNPVDTKRLLNVISTLIERSTLHNDAVWTLERCRVQAGNGNQCKYWIHYIHWICFNCYVSIDFFRIDFFRIDFFRIHFFRIDFLWRK